MLKLVGAMCGGCSGLVGAKGNECLGCWLQGVVGAKGGRCCSGQWVLRVLGARRWVLRVVGQELSPRR